MNELAALAEKLGPEVAEQMFRWGTVANTIGLIVGIVLFVAGMTLILIGLKMSGDPEPFVLVGGFAILFSLIPLVACTLTLIQIHICPYAYLLDKITP